MVNRTPVAALLFVLGIGLPPGAFAADDDVVVGILEHLWPAQKKRLDDAYGDVGPAIVRVAFRKQAGRWQAFPSDIGDLDQLKAATRNFPQKLDWTIAFDGKARGHLRSAAPPQWNFYSDVGVELVPRGSKVIAIGHPSTGFERWDSDKPVHRPLVLVTRPDTGDPDQWKPAKLDDIWSAAGIARFRAEVKAEASGLRLRDKDVKLVKGLRLQVRPRAVRPRAEQVSAAGRRASRAGAAGALVRRRHAANPEIPRQRLGVDRRRRLRRRRTFRARVRQVRL
jgi:hypothetical protein